MVQTLGTKQIYSSVCVASMIYHHIDHSVLSVLENELKLVYSWVKLVEAAGHHSLTNIHQSHSDQETTMVPLDITSNNNSIWAENDDLDQWCDLTGGY